MTRAANRANGEKGFTLIELLVVIIILGILAAVVVFATSGVNDKGQSSAFAIDARTVRTAQEAFCARNGRYATMGELVGAGLLSEASTLHSTNPAPGGPCTASGDSSRSSFVITCDASKPGCGEDGATPLRSLRVGYQDPGTLGDTFLNRFEPHTRLFDTLVRIDENHQVQPMLATSWQLLPDGRTYRFTLRQGVKFHDGSAMTATDIKYSIDYYIDSLFLSTMTSPDKANPNRVTIVDPFTIDVSMKTTDKRFLEEIGHPAHGMAKVGSDPASGGFSMPFPVGPANMIGTGPFRFVEYVAGQRVVLERFPDYWDTTHVARTQRLTFRFLPDETARVLAFQAGEIDIVGRITPDSVAAVQAVPGAGVAIANPGGVLALDFHIRTTDSRNSPLEDPLVRSGVARGIDRDALRNAVYPGGTAVASIHPPGLFQGAPAVTPVAFDQAQASADLDAAGWNTLDAQGFRTKAGNRLTLTYVHNLLPANGVDTGTVLKDQLDDIGVEVVISSQPPNNPAFNYDIIGRRSFITEADPCFVYDFVFTSPANGGPGNGIHSPGAVFDNEILACRNLTDIVASRAKAVDAARVVIESEKVRVPIGTDSELWGRTAQVQGFTPSPIQGTARWEDVSVS